jgi:hypothetical protein
MRERLTPVFRLVCIVLAGLILLQVSRLMARRNSFAAIGAGPKMAVSAKVDASTNKPGPVPVPPEIEARVEKIKESQVLGMVMRPPPMALLGIAGPDVILRGPNGQMGMIRVGEELGGVKLLKVGVNRVLVLHEGKTNELTLFRGFGGESLLGKEKSK